MNSKVKAEPIYTNVDVGMIKRLRYIESYIDQQWLNAKALASEIEDVDVRIIHLYELRIALCCKNVSSFIKPESLLFVLFREGQLLFNADGKLFILKNARDAFQATFIPIVEFINMVNIFGENYFSLQAIFQAQSQSRLFNS